MESSDDLTFELANVKAIGSAQWREIVGLCSAAYEEGFDIYFEAIGGTTHVLARYADGLVSHACWVRRWLQPDSGRPLRTAYVEAVATAPGFQSRGYASAVMRRIAAEIAGYELGALSPARPSLYRRLGWERWRGPLAVRTAEGLLPTPREEVMVLLLPQTPELDLDAPMSAEWREGELW